MLVEHNLAASALCYVAALLKVIVPGASQNEHKELLRLSAPCMGSDMLSKAEVVAKPGSFTLQRSKPRLEHTLGKIGGCILTAQTRDLQGTCLDRLGK